MTSCYILNRIPSKELEIPPYVVWKGRKPNLNYFKVRGCVAYYRVFNNKTYNLQPKAMKGTFIGYAFNSKAYRILDLPSNMVVETRDFEFVKIKFLSDSILNDATSAQVIETNKADISNKNIDV